MRGWTAEELGSLGYHWRRIEQKLRDRHTVLAFRIQGKQGLKGADRDCRAQRQWRSFVSAALQGGMQSLRGG